MQREIIKTKDNSKTLLIPSLNETYHSTHGAITEALHIYINHGINQFTSKKDIVSIFEMGFGTGLNAILTFKCCKQNNLKINYKTIEKFPISETEIEHLGYYNEPDLELLKDEYMKMHETPFNNAIQIDTDFSLTKHHTDIKSFDLSENSLDLIYFDAFAPQHQPDLWTKDVLTKMYNSLKTDGFLITYCAQGEFKRTLKAIGFEVIALDGPPGKREITKAIKLR